MHVQAYLRFYVSLKKNPGVSGFFLVPKKTDSKVARRLLEQEGKQWMARTENTCKLQLDLKRDIQCHECRVGPTEQ